jgi:hypothetical protein
VPHLVLLVAATMAVWNVSDPGAAPAPDAAPAPGGAGDEPTRTVNVASHFLLVPLPFAPWVFGAAAVALAYLPALVADKVTGHAPLFSAVATTVTAVTGILAQPLARRIPRPNGAFSLLVSMALVIVGIGCAAWAAYAMSPPIVLLASAVLGVAYGVTQVRGLAEVQRIALDRTLGTTTAAYQVLSYIGFAFPFLMSLGQSRGHLAPATLLLILLAVAAAATAWITVVTAVSRRRRW